MSSPFLSLHFLHFCIWSTFHETNIKGLFGGPSVGGGVHPSVFPVPGLLEEGRGASPTRSRPPLRAPQKENGTERMNARGSGMKNEL